MKDRFDAKYMRDVDPMHFIMPYLLPNRCDNEAFFSYRIDLTKLNKYIKKKNASKPEYKYNMFQCIIAATLKTITLRSKLSIFIHNYKMYKRNEVTAAFTVKQEFADDGGEVLCFIHSKPEWTIDDLHNEMHRQLLKLKDREYKDESSGFMEKFNNLPKFISHPIMKFLCWLERKDMVPTALVETDPYHSSVNFANLGSIGLPSGFHHLTNWGTTSMFIVIGKMDKMPFFKNKEVTFKDAVELNITIDERIADGYYFSRSMKMMQYFLDNPELLDRPFNEKLPDEVWDKL
ncbi:MAG: 2-oxo acid dehydrogenase subunit E2 [Erysipelotrichaceae bacterium]|nr:2-oxo acid dehydrogenase subunit E2 [Erysipelotrichaceae bacterium]